MKKCAAKLLAPLLVLVPAPALAGGNARVVDDAEIVASGTCQIELWGTRGRDVTDIVAGGACAPAALPRLEVGAMAEYVADNRGDDLQIGPAAKYELYPFDGSLGIAVAGSVGFSLEDGRVGSAGVYVPLTAELVPDRLRLNLNVGWAWTNTRFAHEAAWGGQLVYAAAPGLELMGELFGTSGAGAAWQTGLRWTAGSGPIDVDLLYRDDFDGGAGRGVTIGLTVRR